MANKLIFLTVPALRSSDVDRMPNLLKLVEGGSRTRLEHAFPAVTWPAQANVLTGHPPREHGVIANGFYWRDENKVEMWTAWNEVIEKPQIWDLLKERGHSTAAWFPMLSKGCGADYVCMPAPIHKPDGSEDMWCYTRPQEFYGDLLEQLEHFPLQHFWGPLANIKSSAWIADSAALADSRFNPSFFYIYLPHLDYAAQKDGPDSPQALAAVDELDELIGRFAAEINSRHEADVTWVVASEYVIKPVDHVSYPNRILREAGLLTVVEEDGLELLDFANTPAWALVDHQFSHVFVKDADPGVIERVVKLFSDVEGITGVYDRAGQGSLGLDHERSGEVVLESTSNSWQAYYWWMDDDKAPSFARTVDIHRKPGYDPVELCFDMATRSVPLDASLIKGSHGTPAQSPDEHGVIVSSDASMFSEELVRDFELCNRIVSWFEG